MSLPILLIAGVTACFVVQECSAGLMDGGMMAMLPPECKHQAEDAKKKANKIYDRLMKEECGKLCAGVDVKASSLWTHEATLLKALKSMMLYLKTKANPPMDIDHLCDGHENLKFKEHHIWPIYEEAKAKCVKGAGEFDNHPNLCKSKKDDFPKTKKCIEDIVNKAMKEYANPLPMSCAMAAVDKYCNDKFMGPVMKYFLTDTRLNYKLEEGWNLWQLKEEYFAGKCSGTLKPRG